jgi:hypothetical protein
MIKLNSYLVINNMHELDNIDIFNDFDAREAVIREMAERELWDSVESVPEDLLEDF